MTKYVLPATSSGMLGDVVRDGPWLPSVAQFEAYRAREVQLCAANRRRARGLRAFDMPVTTSTWLAASVLFAPRADA